MSDCIYANSKTVKANSELRHYGVLGMKWGVRRTPEQLGRHTIKKGTIMYRSTVNAKESPTGHAYVTYLEVDRDFYRGAYASGIRDQAGRSPNAPLYEKSFKLKEDLTVPSRKELQGVVNDLIKKDKDLNIAKEAGRKRLSQIKEDPRLNDVFIEEFGSKNAMNKIKEHYNDMDTYHAFYSKELQKAGRNFIKEYSKEFGNWPADEQFRYVTATFGTSKYNRNLVIDELKKRGYNAMVDEYGVGNNNHREGVDPLIVFDRDKSLSEVSTKQVDKGQERASTKRYIKWKTVANRYADKSKEKRGSKYAW